MISSFQSCQKNLKRKIIIRQSFYLFLYLVLKDQNCYLTCHKTKYIELHLKLLNVLFSKSIFPLMTEQ